MNNIEKIGDLSIKIITADIPENSCIVYGDNGHIVMYKDGKMVSGYYNINENGEVIFTRDIK